MSRTPQTSHQYQAWIHRQLEPEDVIITGNHKRIKPVNVVYANIPDTRTPGEWEALEDEIITKHQQQHETK